MTERESRFQETVEVLTGAFVAVAIVTLTCITTWYILTHDIPDRNETIIGQLQGSLWTSLGVIVGYFYVRSRSSQKKDEAIADMAKTAKVAGAALGPSAEGIILPPGEAAKVTATEDGTEIKPDP